MGCPSLSQDKMQPVRVAEMMCSEMGSFSVCGQHSSVQVDVFSSVARRCRQRHSVQPNENGIMLTNPLRQWTDTVHVNGAGSAYGF
jgi:hypothetical protein